MTNLVAIAYPDGGGVIPTELGPEREAELQEALAGQAAAV